jgi:hypothetical protein
MFRAGSGWRTFKASADHLSFNLLDDRIKLIRRKVRKWARERRRYAPACGRNMGVI